MTDTIDTARLLSTTDAQVWAQTFLQMFYVLPKHNDLPEDETAHSWQEGLMIAWFANAIEVGRSAGRNNR